MVKKHLQSDEIGKHSLVKILQAFVVNDLRDRTRKIDMAQFLRTPYNGQDCMEMPIEHAFFDFIYEKGIDIDSLGSDSDGSDKYL